MDLFIVKELIALLGFWDPKITPLLDSHPRARANSASGLALPGTVKTGSQEAALSSYGLSMRRSWELIGKIPE